MCVPYVVNACVFACVDIALQVPCTTIDPRERKLSKKEFKWHAAKVCELCIFYTISLAIRFILYIYVSTKYVSASMILFMQSINFHSFFLCMVSAKGESQSLEVACVRHQRWYWRNWWWKRRRTHPRRWYRKGKWAAHSGLFRAHVCRQLPGPSPRLHMYRGHAPWSGSNAFVHVYTGSVIDSFFITSFSFQFFLLLLLYYVPFNLSAFFAFWVLILRIHTH